MTDRISSPLINTSTELIDKCSIVKQNVSFAEYAIHKMVCEMGGINVPKIYRYNANDKSMRMQRLYGLSVADMFGDKIENVPIYIINAIRDVILKLYLSNIYYPDITGYNFMFIHNKIWVYDFGHAICSGTVPPNVEFIKEFIDGKNEWNPEFA
jgi:tRNA A-37 threonylcarbamoyl transferase component Bud32